MRSGRTESSTFLASHRNIRLLHFWPTAATSLTYLSLRSICLCISALKGAHNLQSLFCLRLRQPYVDRCCVFSIKSIHKKHHYTLSICISARESNVEYLDSRQRSNTNCQAVIRICQSHALSIQVHCTLSHSPSLSWLLFLNVRRVLRAITGTAYPSPAWWLVSTCHVLTC